MKKYEGDNLNTSNILADPDFHALRDFERLHVLYTVDPDYRRLHPRERWKVIEYLQKSPQPPQDALLSSSAEEPQVPSPVVEPPIPPQF